MRVLHYTLGWPPQRSGGLTGYSVDLMQRESNRGIDVVSLIPGNYNPFRKIPVIKETDSKRGITVFSLINSLPLPLRKAIRNPDSFMQPVPVKIFLDFLKLVRPDVIHVHTLMGIYKEFFIAAKKLGIPIVYTTHDYFGLAPNAIFYDEKDDCSFHKQNDIENWIKCGKTSYPTWKLRVFQSRVYPFLRRQRKNFVKHKQFETMLRFPKNDKTIVHSSPEDIMKFNRLKSYYEDIFRHITEFFYNSEIAKSVFESKLSGIKKSTVIPVTNGSIQFDENPIKLKNDRNDSKLKIGYIGAYNSQKGFNYLIQNFTRLDKNKFELHIFGDRMLIDNLPFNIINHGRFSQREMDEVYACFDVLVVPSRWMETFGLTALEAISRGKIVLVSNNAGAKMLFNSNNIFVPRKNNLGDKIQSLYDSISNFSECIYIPHDLVNMETHTNRVIEEYELVLKKP